MHHFIRAHMTCLRDNCQLVVPDGNSYSRGKNDGPPMSATGGEGDGTIDVPPSHGLVNDDCTTGYSSPIWTSSQQHNHHHAGGGGGGGGERQLPILLWEAKFNPFVTRTLDAICRAAPATVASASAPIGPESGRIMTALAAAFVLSSSSSSSSSAELKRDHDHDDQNDGGATVTDRKTTPVDLKLAHFAVTQLLSCVRRLLRDEGTAEDDSPPPPPSSGSQGGGANEDEARDAESPDYQDLAKTLASLKALGIPVLPKPGKTRSRKKQGGAGGSGTDDDCTFAGLLPIKERNDAGMNLDEKLLRLFLRSVLPGGEGKPRGDAHMPTRLYARLLGMIQACYDTRDFSFVMVAVPSSPTTVTASVKSVPVETKKAARGQRSSKRRKVVAAATTVTTEEEDATVATRAIRTGGGLKWGKLNEARAGLASDLLTALSICLTRQVAKRPALQLYLRDSFGLDQLRRVVNLNELMERAMIMTKAVAPASQKHDGSSEYDGILFPESATLTVNERSTWTTHVNFCFVLSRGNTTFDGRPRTLPDRMMGSPNLRLEGAKMFLRPSPLHEGGRGWPLHLATAHHAIITSNFASEPLFDDPAAEAFVAAEMIKSIEAVLRSPSVLQRENWYSTNDSNPGDAEAVVFERVPLSPWDCRLLLLAICRLSKGAQLAHLERLVDLVRKAVGDFSTPGELRDMCIASREISSFVSRCVTVIAALANLVDVGSPLRDLLVSQIGASLYPPPPIIPAKDCRREGNESDRNDRSWYTRESCFMGLFTDWESPVVPDVDLVDAERNPIGEATRKKLRDLFLEALNLGFLSAAADKGQLLFSSWNASGRQASWDPSRRPPDTVHKLEDDLASPSILLQIREEMCWIYLNLQVDATVTDSLLTTVLRDQALSPSNAQQLLTSAFARVDAIVTLLAEHLREGDRTPSACQLCLLEALPVFIAFLCAMHTRGGTSFFQEPKKNGPRKRRRLHSSTGEEAEILASILSEEDESDGDYDYQSSGDEGKVGAIMRLHDACNVAGAAPVWPDYLDSTCKLRFSISPDEALGNAEIALKCLNTISELAHGKYQASVRDMMECFAKDGASDVGSSRVDMAARLCLLSEEESNPMHLWETEEKEGEFEAALCAICNVDEGAVRFFVNDVECKNRQSAKDAWCPNTIQRIQGNIHDRSITIDGWEVGSAEYRAGGEWELLLSETLLSATLDFEFDTSLGSGDVSSDSSRVPKKAKSLYHISDRWSRISHCSTSNMAAATALMNFSIRRGHGGPPHSLSQRERKLSESTDDSHAEESQQQQQQQRREPNMEVSGAAEDAICKSLYLLPLIGLDNRGDSRPKQSCRAAASNLLLYSALYSDLEALAVTKIALGLLRQLREQVQDQSNADTDTKAAYLMEKILTIFEDFGFISLANGQAAPLLFAYFKCDPLVTIETIIGEKLPTSPSLKSESKMHPTDASQSVQDEALRDLLDILISQRFSANVELRGRIAQLLSDVAEQDYKMTYAGSSWENSCDGSLLRAMVSILKSFDRAQINSLVKATISKTEFDSSTHTGKLLVKNMARFISLLACVETPGESKDIATFFVLEALMESLETISNEPPCRDEVLEVLFLLGTSFGTLGRIGAKLIELCTSSDSWKAETELNLVPIEKLCMYASLLNVKLKAKREPRLKTGAPAVAPVREPKESKPKPSAESSTKQTSSVRRACSFVLHSDYQTQHWYNCYTCGLVWDKGLCSLCLLKCHRGHDVAYSRHSSFFCDCGAEAPTAAEENRVTCKCITPLTCGESQSLFDSDVANSFLFVSGDDGEHRQVAEQRTEATARPSAVDVALSCLGDRAYYAIEEFRSEAASWPASFLQLLEKLRQSRGGRYSVAFDGDGKGPRSGWAHSDSLLMSIRNRSGRPLELQTQDQKCFVAIRASRSNTFNAKVSADATTDRLKRAMHAKNGIQRQVLVADSRGRLILSEPCSLVFCAALPTINTVHVEDPVESQCYRAQLNVLGSSSVKFNVVGMKLCRANERHLVVWGLSEAFVAVLGKNGSSVERTMDLTVDLDPTRSESDFVVKCDWLPGSQTRVAVACDKFIKVFDVCHGAENDGVPPSSSFVLGTEARICDFALVPVKTPSVATSRSRQGRACRLKMFALLSSGRLYFVDISADSGELEDGRTVCIESSAETVTLPTGGVRTYQGLDPCAAGSTSRTLGDGSTLDFLPRCRLLLYKCETSCTLALILDNMGDVAGSFEFLPHLIPADVLGQGADGFVSGPFSHWTEIGTVGEQDAYRVVCVVKSSRTDHPKLLCVDFNGKGTKVKPFAWPCTTSMGLGLSICSSFEGVSAFSAPMREGRSRYSERAYVSVLTSGGSMLFFGEDSEQAKSQAVVMPHHRTSGGAIEQSLAGESNTSSARATGAKPVFPLTIFEKLLNVTEDEALAFGGDVLGSDGDGGKTKLSTKNIISPNREGCTITAYFDRSQQRGKSATAREMARHRHDGLSEGDRLKSRLSKGSDNLVIVAVRVLVGSSSYDCIPRRIVVQGRPVSLVPDVKRWYDLPLTRDEIGLAVRNGFVSIGIGWAFAQSNNPVVDALEVYAIDRSAFKEWFPKALRHRDENRNDRQPERTDSVVLCTATLTHLLSVVQSKFDPKSPNGATLKSLVQNTSIDECGVLRGYVIKLLEEMIPNALSRQTFVDEATVSGISDFFQSARDQMAASYSQPSADATDHGRQSWRRIVGQFLDSLHTATEIAQNRPSNYARAVEGHPAEHGASRSVASCALSLLSDAVQHRVDCFEAVDSVTKLLLIEIGICESLKGKGGSFTSIKDISQILAVQNTVFVEAFCESSASFLEQKGKHTGAAKMRAAGGMPSEPPIAFCCDSCSLFPITDCRYTLPEGDHDIDLCTECYRLGQLFDGGPDTPVVIKGNTIGESTKLTYRQLTEMQSVPIADGPSIVAQVEQALQEAKSAAATKKDDGSKGQDSSLQKAIRLSRRENVNFSSVYSRGTDSGKEIDYGKLTDSLFRELLDLTSKKLSVVESNIQVSQINPLLNLLLRLISAGGSEDQHIDRGKRFGTILLWHLSLLIEKIGRFDESDRCRRVLLINILRSLSRLLCGGKTLASPSMIVIDTDTTPAEKSKEKTDPRFVCDEHGVPAVRRRVSSGPNKNRRFYVCGMERNIRCKYFKWADEAEETDREAQGKEPLSKFSSEIENSIWKGIVSVSEGGDCALSAKLSDFLDSALLQSEKQSKTSVCLPNEVLSLGPDQGASPKTRTISSLYGRRTALADYDDGVFCSREKLRGEKYDCHFEDAVLDSRRPLLLLESDTTGMHLEEKAIEAALDLISVVGKAADDELPHEATSQSRWFSLLCELISLSATTRFRAQAKKALKRLCGGKRSLYYSVRDHYVFGFQFRKLIGHSFRSLDAALNIREQARQCGPDWRKDELSWFNADAGALVSTQELIAEDYNSVASVQHISSILDELMNATKVRGGNWRHFCGLSSLPQSQRKIKNVVPKISSYSRAGGIDFLTNKVPPVMCLIWLACSLPVLLQIKLFKLIETALTPHSEKQSGPKQRQTDDLSSDGEVFEDEDEETTSLSLNLAQSTPCEILLRSDCGFSVDTLHAFIVQFVLRGRFLELRKIAGQVSASLCRELSTEDFYNLLMRLVGLTTEIAALGSMSIQYLQLLQALLKNVEEKNFSLDMKPLAEILIHCFTLQMESLRNTSSGRIGDSCVLEMPGQGRDQAKKRFDLCPCAHCHRVKPNALKVTRQPVQGRSIRRVANDRASPSSQADGRPWLPEQVRPFVRSRLEASTDSSASNDFSFFVQLKCRLAISEIHLTVNDVRGRYVKTIAVFFSPRQVKDSSELKSEDYSELWQQCGTLSLIRGATHSSTALPIPVVAANLKFEYKEFYERPGDSRASDGSTILHCPRCTRVVNHSHGVCSSCGEVAFQCRKCRHINYDRLDAFLCVECGYCASGGFSYELVAGTASNVVAVVDNESYERAVKTLQISTKLYGELRNTLEEKMKAAQNGKRSRDGPDDLAAFGPSVKRALRGELPSLDQDGQTSRSSSVITTARTSAGGELGGNRLSSAANRARTLVRLAQTLRSSGDASERSAPRRELLIREAFLGSGSQLSIEDLPEVSGLLNIQEEAGDGGGGGNDPLSRIVASIRGRSEREGRSVGRRISPNSSSPTISNNKMSTKARIEECEKIFHLMREAERETFEVQRRIQAWQRLERDGLQEVGVAAKVVDYAPTHCTKCSGPVTLHLLILVMRLFHGKQSPGTLELSTWKRFIRALFMEPPAIAKDLLDMKRLAIATFATKSERASKLILEELQLRLRASNGDDVASGVILGKIIEDEDCATSSDFFKLATTCLEGRF